MANAFLIMLLIGLLVILTQTPVSAAGICQLRHTEEPLSLPSRPAPHNIFLEETQEAVLFDSMGWLAPSQRIRRLSYGPTVIATTRPRTTTNISLRQLLHSATVTGASGPL